MRRASVWIGFGCALVVAGGASALEDRLAAGPEMQIAYARRLPEGPGRDIAERSCLVCHSATLMTQQAKDSTAWTKTVTQMQDWGVVLSVAERESLVVYLSERLKRRGTDGGGEQR